MADAGAAAVSLSRLGAEELDDKGGGLGAPSAAYLRGFLQQFPMAGGVRGERKRKIKDN